MPQLRFLREQKAQDLAQPAQAGPAVNPAKLDCFWGDGQAEKGKEVLSFMDWVTRYYAMPGRPERSVLTSYLRGPAADWYNTNLRHGWDHDELLVQLGIRFHDEGKQVASLQQLMRLQQGSMHIAQFNQRFLQLALAAQKLDDSDIVVRYASACGLGAREVIRRHQLYTSPLATVMQRVQQEVMMEQGFGALMASVDVRGAAQQQQPQLMGPVPMELGAMRAQHNAGQGQRAGKCYECGGRGHIKAACANRTRAQRGRPC